VRIIEGEDDERVTELVRRKREYWRKARESRLFPNSGKKNDGTKGPKKATKQKKEPPKKEARREEGQTEISTSVRVKRDELNPNSKLVRIQTPRSSVSDECLVQAAHPAIPCRPLEDILDDNLHLNTPPGGPEYKLAFQNFHYRATVRVVDFFPPRLEDFAVSYSPEDDLLSASEDSSEDSDGDAVMTSSYPHRRRIWEWRFCLLVENGKSVPRGQPKERMRLFVSGKDAEYLLKIDATK
jgi:hypothetical protein